jgi:hypothetical protein
MPEVEANRGYLASALLVGRQREVDLLRRRVRKARRGQGSAFVLEAPVTGDANIEEGDKVLTGLSQ